MTAPTIRIPWRVRFRAAWHHRPGHGSDGFWNSRQGIHCSGCGQNIGGDWNPGAEVGS